MSTCAATDNCISRGHLPNNSPVVKVKNARHDLWKFLFHLELRDLSWIYIEILQHLEQFQSDSNYVGFPFYANQFRSNLILSINSRRVFFWDTLGTFYLWFNNKKILKFFICCFVFKYLVERYRLFCTPICSEKLGYSQSCKFSKRSLKYSA